MSKIQRCCGCEKPTTDFIISAGQRLPYHPECAAAAWRDLRAIRDGLAARLQAGRSTAAGGWDLTLGEPVIKGWLDDSRQKHVWAVAGFVGFIDQWEDFEASWPQLLATHDVPHLHMREMARPAGVYAKWHPLKSNPKRRISLLMLPRSSADVACMGLEVSL
jgi:hypothetical protein